jgi:hypothetical protein
MLRTFFDRIENLMAGFADKNVFYHQKIDLKIVLDFKALLEVTA